MIKEDKFNTTHENILDAANRVLSKKGAEGFTLESVAMEVGVSKGGLLYHFPSKNKLIEGMITRSIARIEKTLEEELKKHDYLTAYIRASFQTIVEPEQISRALLAAVANDPVLLEPIRQHCVRMQNEIAAAAPSEAIGTLIRLCLDGLWQAEMLQFAPPSPELKNKLQETLLSFVSGFCECENNKS